MNLDVHVYDRAIELFTRETVYDWDRSDENSNQLAGQTWIFYQIPLPSRECSLL